FGGGQAKKVDPPGGQPGGSGAARDEGPLPDANPRDNQAQSISVTAGTHAADVIAVGVELANEAAAAIAVVIVTVVAGADRASDDRSTHEAGANAPTPADRLGPCPGGAGAKRARHSHRR